MKRGRVHLVYKNVLIVYAPNEEGYGEWMNGQWYSVVDFLLSVYHDLGVEDV